MEIELKSIELGVLLHLLLNLLVGVVEGVEDITDILVDYLVGWVCNTRLEVPDQGLGVKFLQL